MPADPVQVGIIGMTGFAGAHHGAVRELEKTGACHLVCTSTRDVDACRARADELQLNGRGVRLYGDYVQMLDECRDLLEVVIIPSALPLHAEMHKACVERGLPAYLEKPPTLDYAEFEAMLSVEAAASKLTNVGFNYIIEDERRALKGRLLDGEFGRVRTVCFSGLWPRARSYYERTFWAGRLVHEGRLVLDSPLGNAMAHFAHNLLFWAGADALWSWGEADRVEAELYRANRIEGPDTIFAKAVTADGTELRLALSHACSGDHRGWERVICEKAVLHYDVSSGYRIVRDDGTTEAGDFGERDLLPKNLAAYFDYVRGKAERPITTLADSGPFVRLYDLVLIAGREIHQIPEPFAQTLPAPDRDTTLTAVQDVGPVFERFFSEDLFPSKQAVPWARKGGGARPGELALLREVISHMVAESS